VRCSAKESYRTRKAAETACAALIRRWVRAEPLGNYVFDDEIAGRAVMSYLRGQWPGRFDEAQWLFDVNDKQVDEIVNRMGVVFAQVSRSSRPTSKPPGTRLTTMAVTMATSPSTTTSS
jgi:hypothetical protein